MSTAHTSLFTSFLRAFPEQRFMEKRQTSGRENLSRNIRLNLTRLVGRFWIAGICNTSLFRSADVTSTASHLYAHGIARRPLSTESRQGVENRLLSTVD